ncbi:FAD:protein FMN transferase [Lignipirellula cremea]|uniref:FAD:protein FMN transferase n=1 Tax=Lignipirellula cremea TaxID=2528010 RepID=A0A518DU31_9BACT|nr:FAD:protein FMN transferase [Lignipirellula cremea]QDU95347.1 Thiamine biosynthesis lipoprotein ApbE precursor [Lignipirellula cremea]
MSDKRKTTRREFLRGEAAVEALADLTHGPATPIGQGAPGGKSAQSDLLLHFTRRAMACDFTVYLNARQYADGPDRAMDALDLVDELEDQLTVYRGHSEVSQLNRRATTASVALEWGLYALLRTADRLFQETEGAFDMTAGPLTKLWGFYRREGRLPGNEEIEAVRQQVGGELLEFDDALHAVRFRREGVEINLGGIGKGYALDEAAQRLRMGEVNDFLFHGGNSSLIAWGDRGGVAGQGWTVGVIHPMRPEQRLGELRLHNQALATSGAGSQHFYHKGKKYGHILDPRTGHPAEGVHSTTVLAPSAAIADALATAFYVQGPEFAKRYCDAHPDISLLMTTPGERAGEIGVHRANLTDEQWLPNNG